MYFFIHISNRNTSRDHGCLGALLSFQLQLSALDSHCQKGCRCWRFFAGNYRIPEDDSRSCYCIYIYIYRVLRFWFQLHASCLACFQPAG